MSETASAPCCSAAAATAAGEAQLGVSLTISGLAARGRTASSSAAVSPGSAPISSPVLTFGHETLSSSAATSGRAENAATSAPTSAWLEPMTLTISGTGSSASAGRSSARKRSSPLLGSPIELIMPAPSSHRRGGGLPCARRERDRLGDERGEREAREQRVAEHAPGGDRVERARGVDDRVRELEAEAPHQATSARSAAGEHGAVDAQPHVAAARRHDAAEAGAEAAGHAGLERELGRDVVLGAQRPHRLEHRRRAAGVDRRTRVAAQLRRQQLGHQPAVPDRPVVGGHARAGQQRGALGVRGVAEAEQHERVARRARRAGSPAARSRRRRRPGAAGGRARARRSPARAGRAATARRPASSSASRSVPGPDVLEQEVERPVGVAARDREGAREERALVRAAAPALGRGEHVELARARARGRPGSATESTT